MEITLEQDIVVLTTKTVEYLLDKNPDSLSLYLFYVKNAKIQKTNQVWSTDVFCMNGLGWGRTRFTAAKQVLLDANLISVVERRSKTGKITGRYMKINYLWKSETVQEISHVYQKPQVDEPTRGEQTTNALSNDNINALSNTKEMLISETVLPEHFGNTPLIRLLKYYTMLFYNVYKFNPKIEFGRFNKTMNDLRKEYTELQIAWLLTVFFNWRGMNGEDQRENDFLVKITFPITAFAKNINQYEAYVRNVLGRGKEFDIDKDILGILGY